MRSRILISLLVAAVAAMALIQLAQFPYSTVHLRMIMARHGLSAANVAYGRAGVNPSFIAINAPNDLVRPFYSLSKPVTAAVALEVLQLDEVIEGATVRQVLQHSGGWDYKVAGDVVSDRHEIDKCTDIPTPEKQFPSGSYHAYSNFGYCLLGRVIEERSGQSYQDLVVSWFPEFEAMQYDPWLGPAGGWSGTVADYFKFASRAVPSGTTENPISRSGETPYGLGWGVGPDYLTHFGLFKTNFAVVVKQGDFVAVAVFDGAPHKSSQAASEVREALMRLNR